MHYADIKKADIANGLGVRVSVFVSGCTHHCKNCFNSEAWDFNYGKEFTGEEIEKVINELDHPYVSGLSLLGGEPLEYSNQKGLLPLLRKVKEKFPEKNIWCYTGYKFDQDVMNDMCNKWEETPEILSYLDVVVDGKFEEDKKDLKLRFRGSSNQRVIDVKKSLKEKKAILFEF
ncbi:MAG: anaerobic ribonucleoside-triphosphate reductase activating protein [Clostridia bacterium]|nr:anaerobic ribonucleoside-triphosphate reductase activating protein [Clostridia bacterium]